jgi:hypothetical protein
VTSLRFFVDVKWVSRVAFDGALKAWYSSMRADEAFVRFDLVLDPVPVYGVPTLWAKDRFSQWTVAFRGNQSMLPYAPARGDFDLLKAAPRPRWSRRRSSAGTKRRPPNVPPLLLPIPLRSFQAAQDLKAHPNLGNRGGERRAKLLAKMKGENTKCTENEFVSAYQIQRFENGGGEEARRDFRRVEKRFVVHARDRTNIDMNKTSTW